MASALIKLANAATEEGDYQTTSGFLEEALAIWRELGDQHGTARALISLGHAALRAGDSRQANARLEEALALSRELGDTRSMGFELSGLSEAALRQHDYARAARLGEESLALRRQLSNKWGVGVSLGTLGWVAMRQGDLPRAMAQWRESLDVRQEIGDMGGSAWCLERLAEVARARQQPERAVRLLGAAEALRASIGSVIDPVDQPEYENHRASLRAEIGETRFAAAWDDGRVMTLEQAVAQAFEGSVPDSGARRRMVLRRAPAGCDKIGQSASKIVDGEQAPGQSAESWARECLVISRWCKPDAGHLAFAAPEMREESRFGQ